jgi:hypothetical protein
MEKLTNSRDCRNNCNVLNNKRASYGNSECNESRIFFLQAPKPAENMGNDAIVLLTFTKLELVKNGCFTGSIETDHQDSHLFLSEL